MISRRAFLVGGGLLALGCESGGCDNPQSIPSGPTDDGSIPTEGGGPGAGVGNVGSATIGYSNVGSLNGAEARTILATGANFLALETTNFGAPPASVDEALGRIRGAVQACRQVGAQLMVIGINANSPEQRALGDAWWVPFMDGLNAIGTANIWLQPVTEPKVGDLTRIRWAFARWPGIKVTNAGHANSTSIPADRVDRHYCSYAALLAGVRTRGDWIHSTDCTPTLASSLSAAQITEVVREAKARGRTLLLYDTFRAAANPVVIERLQAALAA